jgi:hypothetical protein
MDLEETGCEAHVWWQTLLLVLLSLQVTPPELVGLHLKRTVWIKMPSGKLNIINFRILIL